MRENKLIRGGSVLLLLASFAFLQSCNLIDSLLNPNEDPTVRLVADYYDVVTDQPVTFTATASDPDGDSLTYTWKVDGDIMEGLTDNEIYLYWMYTLTLYPTISVTVDDGNGGSATASVTITVTPMASLRVYNKSSYSITDIKYRNNTNDSYGDDLLDLLGLNELLSDWWVKFYGFPPDNYQVKLTNSQNISWEFPDSSSTGFIGAGQHYDITVNSDNSAVGEGPFETLNIVPAQGTQPVSSTQKAARPSPGSGIVKGLGYTLIPIDMLDSAEENVAGRDQSIPFVIHY